MMLALRMVLLTNEPGRPLGHEDVEGSVTIFRKFGGRYRAQVSLSEIKPLPEDHVDPREIVPASALSPNSHKITGVKYGPQFNYSSVYTTDADGNPWSLHIKNPDVEDRS